MIRDRKRTAELLEKKIGPVYKELSAKIGEADSQIMPYVLERLATLQQAKIANELPLSNEEIAKKLKLDKATVDKEVQVMFERGLLFPGKSGWKLIRSWPALHDSAPSSQRKYWDDDLFDLCLAKAEETSLQRIEEVEQGKSKAVRVGMRVIPSWKAVKDLPGILPHEDIKKILKNAEPLALLACPCKVIDRNRECKEKIPLETCITIGRSAEYNLRRGCAKKLTYEEALELIDHFEKYPMVHTVGNRDSMPALLCNCHICCCGGFHRDIDTRKRLGVRAIAKSRFMAQVDTSKCKACKTCVSRCTVGAARMKFYPEYGGERAYIEPDECFGCGVCVANCPNGARRLVVVKPPDSIPSVATGPTED